MKEGIKMRETYNFYETLENLHEKWLLAFQDAVVFKREYMSKTGQDVYIQKVAYYGYLVRRSDNDEILAEFRIKDR